MIGHLIIWVALFLCIYCTAKLDVKASKAGVHSIWTKLFFASYFFSIVSVIGAVISIYSLVARLFLYLTGF